MFLPGFKYIRFTYEQYFMLLENLKGKKLAKSGKYLSTQPIFDQKNNSTVRLLILKIKVVT